MATSVLGLKTFAASDPVDYNEINENYNKIDNGVKTSFQGRAAHNLLDNSWFVNPVNQRGQTVYTGSAFTVDRWRTWNDSATITLTSDGIKGDGTDASVLYQGIELHKIKLGTAYTVAAGYSDGTISCGAGTLTTSSSVGIWNSEAQVCLLWGDGSPFMRLWHATKTIQWVVIYPGSYDASTLPAYVPKGYAAELAECQRQYFPVFESETTYAYWTKADGDTCKIYIPSPKMRVNPTPVLYDGGCTVYLAGNSTWSNAVTLQYYGYAQGCNVFSFASPSTYFETGKTYLYRGIKALSAEM